MSLNFGTFQGDKILGQALQNVAQARTNAVQQEKDNDMRAANQKIQQQYADHNQANFVMEQYIKGRQIDEYKQADFAEQFAQEMLPAFKLKEAPLVFTDGFFSNRLEANEESNKYLSVDKKDELEDIYNDRIAKAGLKPTRARFEQMYSYLLDNQVKDINQSLAMLMQEHPGKIDADMLNKGLDKTGAGQILRQAMVQKQVGSDPMQMGYTPGGQTGGGLGTGHIVAQTLAQTRNWKVAKQGIALAKAGETGKSMGALKNLLGANQYAKFSRLAAEASTEVGFKALMERVERRFGGKIATAVMSKVGAKMSIAGLTGASYVGLPVSVALTAWSLYDAYDIISEMMD